ncbi:hypothetical protein ACFLWR_01890 [Chloroflexota bacterium]
MNRNIRLENGADPQGRRNSQVARNEVECQRIHDKQDGLHTATLASDTRSPATKSPVSFGFIALFVNEDKANIPHWHEITKDKLTYALMFISEGNQIHAFLDYITSLDDKRILISNLNDSKIGKLLKASDASRYFPVGRKRIKAKIYKRLGRWNNCPGVLLSLTFAPEQISRREAWLDCRKMAREFMNRVNRWRKRHGMSKAKFLSCIEAQPGTGYPHIHIVFPYLRWIAPIDFLTQTWGQDVNSVDVTVKDSISPVSYVCKYITKLEGWSDLALSYIWTNRTRLYSMSRDYNLPDYSDKRVPEWSFNRCLSKSQSINMLVNGMTEYDALLGADEIVSEIILRGLS